MTIQEAEKILDANEQIEDLQCGCHINPPCYRCELKMELELELGIELSEEIIEEAYRVEDNHYDKENKCN